MIIPVENEAAWHALRAKHIGASEVAALFGQQPDYAQSLYSLWQIKSGRIPAPAVEGPRIEAGRRLESAIAHWIAFGQNWRIAQFKGYAVSDTCEGMGATPDFDILDHADGPGLLEVKSVDWLQHKRQWTNGEPPMHILLQVQSQLHCTGYKWAYVGALVGGNEPVTYRVDYRPKIGAEIEKRVAAFWLTVKLGQEPAVDGSDTTAAALAAMYPEAEPAKAHDFDGDNQFGEQWSNLTQAILNRKAAAATEQAAKNWILSKIGDAELVKFKGQILATYKTQKRKAYSVEASSSRVLRVKDL